MNDPDASRPSRRCPSRRCNADYRWTRQKAIAFLHALRACGSVARAARGLGMSRQSAYRLRTRYGADYAAVWDEAVDLWRRLGPLPPRPAPAPQGDGVAPQGYAAVSQDDGLARTR